MRVTDMFRRALMFVPVLVVAGAQVACDSKSYSSPTAVPPPGPTATPPSVFWSGTGEITYLSCSGCTCLGFDAGHALGGIYWEVRASQSSIDLYNDADMAFRGTLDGRRFVVDYPITPWDLPDRSRLVGEFAADFRSFEAEETLVASSDEGVCTVVARHRVRAQS